MPNPQHPKPEQRWTIIGAYYGDAEGQPVPSRYVEGPVVDDGERIEVVPETELAEARAVVVAAKNVVASRVDGSHYQDELGEDIVGTEALDVLEAILEEGEAE